MAAPEIGTVARQFLWLSNDGPVTRRPARRKGSQTVTRSNPHDESETAMSATTDDSHAGHGGAPMQRSRGEPTLLQSASRIERRAALRRLGVGAAIAWTAPLIVSGPAFAQGSPTTTTTMPPQPALCVPLGAAATFGVLGASTVTNTGPSVITGDVGVSPGSAITGFPPGTVNSGTIHSADAVAAQAQTDVTIAYGDTAGRPPDATVTTDLGGQTLLPGVYNGATLDLTGTLTLDAQGDPDAVWVFQAGSTLMTASGSAVLLIGGANPCNVFWQVVSSATLGTNSTFVGTILALVSITATTGAMVDGRLLARTGAVMLDSNAVTSTGCAPCP